MCIAWELEVHAAMGEVIDDTMVVAVDDGASILIIYLIETVLLGGYFGFRYCYISTIFLMVNFCTVDFFHQSVYFGSVVLYSEAILTSCYCTSRMFAISCCCTANYFLSCSMALEDSSFSSTETVV